MTVQKRFIAGAACPECGAVDKVRRCSDEDRVWMECVACGMERKPDDDNSSGNRIDVRTE